LDAKINDPPTTGMTAKNNKLVNAGFKEATRRIPVAKEDTRAIARAAAL
jgi:hypothetical protein